MRPRNLSQAGKSRPASSQSPAQVPAGRRSNRAAGSIVPGSSPTSARPPRPVRAVSRPPAPSAGTADELSVAELVAPQGLQGGVRAISLTDFPEDLNRLTDVIVEGAERRTLRLLHVRMQGRMLIFQFQGIDTLEAAESLRGSLVKIPRSQAHELPPGHFYHSDIVGLEVFT